MFELVTNLNINDRDVYIDKFWTLSFLLDASDECRSMLVENNLLYIIISFLDNSDLSLLAPSLRIFEILIRNYKITHRKAIETNFPYYLKHLLTVDNVDLRKDGCRLLSILLDKESELKDMILQDEEILSILQNRLTQDSFDVKIEAVSCIATAVYNESSNVFPFIHFIPSLLALLNIADNLMITHILSILLKLLKISEAKKDQDFNIVADDISENDGVEILKKLIYRTHNDVIYDQISKILTYCENSFEEIIID